MAQLQRRTAPPGSCIRPQISGPGSRCLARGSPSRAPFLPGAPRGRRRAEDGLPAVGSLGRWPGRALCVPGGRCHAGWGLECRGSEVRVGSGIWGCSRGSRVVEDEGAAGSSGFQPTASAPKWTQCQVDGDQVLASTKETTSFLFT